VAILHAHQPINIGTPNNGGAVITVSGIDFIAAATDNLMRTIDMQTDMQTGETLWKTSCPPTGRPRRQFMKSTAARSW